MPIFDLLDQMQGEQETIMDRRDFNKMSGAGFDHGAANWSYSGTNGFQSVMRASG